MYHPMLQLFLLIPVFHYCDELGGPASSRYYSFLYLDPEVDEEFIFDVFEMNWKHYDSKKHEIKTHVTAASAVTIAAHCLQPVILYKSPRMRLEPLLKELGSQKSVFLKKS